MQSHFCHEVENENPLWDVIDGRRWRGVPAAVFVCLPPSSHSVTESFLLRARGLASFDWSPPTITKQFSSFHHKAIGIALILMSASIESLNGTHFTSISSAKRSGYNLKIEPFSITYRQIEDTVLFQYANSTVSIVAFEVSATYHDCSICRSFSSLKEANVQRVWKPQGK